MIKRSNSEKVSSWLNAADAFERIAESEANTDLKNVFIEQAWFWRKQAGIYAA